MKFYGFHDNTSCDSEKMRVFEGLLIKSSAPMKNCRGGVGGVQGKLNWPPDKYYTDKFVET